MEPIPFHGKTPNIAEAAFVAENATILGDVTLGKGSSVWYGVVLRGDSGPIVIGENSNVQDCSVLHCGAGGAVVLGKGVSVGHCALVHGCTVGDNTLIGMHATLLNGSVVGKNCIIGAGALIPEGMVVPDNSVVMGVPGKIKYSTTPAHTQRILHNAEVYVKEAAEHAALKNNTEE